MTSSSLREWWYVLVLVATTILVGFVARAVGMLVWLLVIPAGLAGRLLAKLVDRRLQARRIQS